MKNRAIDQIVTLDLALGTNSLSLPILVGDAEGDTTIGRVFVDYDFATGSSIFTREFIVVNYDGPTGEALRSVDVSGLAAFAPGTCHRIELLASSGFQNRVGDAAIDADRLPIRPNDLTRVIWWVQVVDALNPSVSMAACP